MFSLIITIISIALVAILAIVTIYYGGDAFSNSQEKADAAKTINAGQQITGAIQLYKADTGGLPTTLSALTSGKQYLNALPDGEWITEADSVVAAVNQSQCKEINRQLGLDLATVPTCSDPQYTTIAVCCEK